MTDCYSTCWNACTDNRHLKIFTACLNTDKYCEIYFPICHSDGRSRRVVTQIEKRHFPQYVMVIMWF